MPDGGEPSDAYLCGPLAEICGEAAFQGRRATKSVLGRFECHPKIFTVYVAVYSRSTPANIRETLKRQECSARRTWKTYSRRVQECVTPSMPGVASPLRGGYDWERGAFHSTLGESNKPGSRTRWSRRDRQLFESLSNAATLSPARRCPQRNPSDHSSLPFRFGPACVLRERILVAALAEKIAISVHGSNRLGAQQSIGFGVRSYAHLCPFTWTSSATALRVRIFAV